MGSNLLVHDSRGKRHHPYRLRRISPSTTSNVDVFPDAVWPQFVGMRHPDGGHRAIENHKNLLLVCFTRIMKACGRPRSPVPGAVRSARTCLTHGANKSADR